MPFPLLGILLLVVVVRGPLPAGPAAGDAAFAMLVVSLPGWAILAGLRLLMLVLGDGMPGAGVDAPGRERVAGAAREWVGPEGWGWDRAPWFGMGSSNG